MPHAIENTRHNDVIHIFEIIKNMFDNEHHCQTSTRVFCLIFYFLVCLIIAYSINNKLNNLFIRAIRVSFGTGIKINIKNTKIFCMGKIVLSRPLFFFYVHLHFYAPNYKDNNDTHLNFQRITTTNT